MLLHHEPPDELLSYEGVRTSLEALLPYTGICRCGGTGGALGASLGSKDCLTMPLFPRAPLSATQPDPAGRHFSGLPVVQHEAGATPCRPPSPLRLRTATWTVGVEALFAESRTFEASKWSWALSQALSQLWALHLRILSPGVPRNALEGMLQLWLQMSLRSRHHWSHRS